MFAGMALALLTYSAAAVAGNATVSCASGRTVFREHGVRIVLVVRQTHFSHGQNSSFKTFYVCPRGARRGRKFREGSPFTREHVTDFRVFGARIGFVANVEGVQSGAGEEVGWVEVNTARSESGPIAETAGIPREQERQEEKEGVPPVPHVPDEYVNYVIAGDGTVAVAASGEALESMTPGAPPPRGMGGLPAHRQAPRFELPQAAVPHVGEGRSRGPCLTRHHRHCRDLELGERPGGVRAALRTLPRPRS